MTDNDDEVFAMGGRTRRRRGPGDSIASVGIQDLLDRAQSTDDDMQRRAVSEMKSRQEDGSQSFHRIWRQTAMLHSAVEGLDDMHLALHAARLHSYRSAPDEIDPDTLHEAHRVLRHQLHVANATFEWMYKGEWRDDAERVALDRLSLQQQQPDPEKDGYRREQVLATCKKARTNLLRVFLGSGLMLEWQETPFGVAAKDDDLDEYRLTQPGPAMHEITSGASWLLYFADEPPLLDIGGASPVIDSDSLLTWRKLLVFGRLPLPALRRVLLDPSLRSAASTMAMTLGVGDPGYADSDWDVPRLVAALLRVNGGAQAVDTGDIDLGFILGGGGGDQRRALCAYYLGLLEALLKARRLGIDVKASVAVVLRRVREEDHDFDRARYDSLVSRDKRTMHWLRVIERHFGRGTVIPQKRSASQPASSGATLRRSTGIDEDLSMFLPGTATTPQQRRLTDVARKRAHLYQS